MVFDYKVKYNGKYYEVGEDVPMDEPKGTSKPAPIEQAEDQAVVAEEKKAVEPTKKSRTSRKRIVED